jgi:two-component system LytT family response regulator
MRIVLIVDSHEQVRQGMKDLLLSTGKSLVLWECSSGWEAERYIDALQPDLIFIDAQLHGKNGFEVLGSAEHEPAVIFLSACGRDAARAYEFKALAPFKAERLQRAVRRLEYGKAWIRKLQLPTSIAYPLVELGCSLIGILTDKIMHLKADKTFSWTHTLDVEKTLHPVEVGESKWNLRRFIRRSYIINTDYLQERDIPRHPIFLPKDVEIHVR